MEEAKSSEEAAAASAFFISVTSTAMTPRPRLPPGSGTGKYDARQHARSYPHQGRRTAEGRLRTQTVADPFLGWTRIDGKDFLVRQWSDHKASLRVELLADGGIHDLAVLCGEAAVLDCACDDTEGSGS